MMRLFYPKEEYKKILTPEIVSLLTKIHEYRGKQGLFGTANPEILSQLPEIAKIQSTAASNQIEGIVTTKDRLKKLVLQKTMPRNRSEKEIAGYRDVLSIIHESYDYIPLRPNLILQLHRDLYKFTGSSVGGTYKTADNVIAETDVNGNEHVCFRPVPAWETPDSLKNLCDAYDAASADPEIDKLILLPMFILDFLCIHPFSDGNGRMSRLLTLLLLYRSGYTVGKYISLERLVSDSKKTYYETLQASSEGWHENENDYLPFVRYLLGIIVAAYREFAERVESVVTEKPSKADRVRDIIRQHTGQITKSEVMEACPDISQVTVQRSLAELLDRGDIIKIGGGRYTKYIRNYDKEN